MWVWEHALFDYNPKRPDSTKKDKTVEVITKADHDAALRRAKAEGKLVWSSERPKVEGHYWFRAPKVNPRVVFVHDGQVYDRLWTDPVSHYIKGEWAGPITLPLDARAASLLDSVIADTREPERFEP